MVKKRHFIIVISILLVGLIVGSFLDLQINQAIYSKGNMFGIIMAAFGTVPCYAGLAFLGGGLFGATLKRKDLHPAIRFSCYVLAVVAYGVSIYLGSKDVPSANAFNNESLRLPGIIISAVLFAGVAYLGFRACFKEDRKELWALTLVMIVIFTVGLLPVSYVIKLFIHRPRFRYVVYSGEIPFHNWWESYKAYKDYLATNPVYEGINITKEEFKSFPSGHSGSAAILMMFLPYFSSFYPKLKGKETLLFYIGFAFTLLMMFSRMLVGAHYLTDTCMGALLLMAVYFIVHVFAHSKGWIFNEEQPKQEATIE